MAIIHVKINRDKVDIEQQTFIDLLDISPIKEYSSYIDAINQHEISFKELKDLAQKAGVPYPLFFAPKEVVGIQIREKKRNIYSKIPGKDEIRLSTRGKFQIQDIDLILTDLSRKQEFLKSRLLPDADTNTFVGCVAKHIKEQRSNKEIADEIRNRLRIDLNHLRTLSKRKVLDYICNCAERIGIFVSFSSYNYMPQNISKEVELSGICVKDKKFPFVFINTRDGDESPKILETSGRQIFSLISMLVCIAMNKFILSIKSDKRGEGVNKEVFEVAGELLIPSEDLQNIKPENLEDLKRYAETFKVTPSMLLVRLRELKLIDPALANSFQQRLSEEMKKKGDGAPSSSPCGQRLC